MANLQLNVIKGKQSTPLTFKARRMINAGYVGRDTDSVKAHVEELRQQGIPAPPSVPMFFPVLSHNITTENEIEVLGNMTSGEVEYVLLLEGGKAYVGVGSDHTDRALESTSIVKSKQICLNVLSRDLWDYEDVKANWDDLLLQSYIREFNSEKEILYQKAQLSTILSAEDILHLVKSKINDSQSDGLIIFSGTIPTLKDEVIYGSYFRGELIDTNMQRKLTCEYRVKKLDYLEKLKISKSDEGLNPGEELAVVRSPY